MGGTKTTPGELATFLPQFLCPKDAYFTPLNRQGSDKPTGGVDLIQVGASEDIYFYDQKNKKCEI